MSACKYQGKIFGDRVLCTEYVDFENPVLVMVDGLEEYTYPRYCPSINGNCEWHDEN